MLEERKRGKTAFLVMDRLIVTRKITEIPMIKKTMYLLKVKSKRVLLYFICTIPFFAYLFFFISNLVQL